MKTYSESRIELRNPATNLEENARKIKQFLSLEQLFELKSLDAVENYGRKNTLGKLVVTVNLEAF